MSAASDVARSRPSNDADRNLALLAYGLLFVAIFFAGLPALVAVAIAYSRRTASAPPARAHFRRQIFIFWVGFALTLLAALTGLSAALILLGEVFFGLIDGGRGGLNTEIFDHAHMGVVMMCIVATGVLVVITGIWFMANSAYGFIRLASRQSISQTAH
ncbi:MAG TPA: hypothetical protein VE309_02680 [Caulobacteraceae bacterium]|jgi:uncharacterized membrane protein|nr:hypothetical protein [Caulobacteraceae bacterium]